MTFRPPSCFVEVCFPISYRVSFFLQSKCLLYVASGSLRQGMIWALTIQNEYVLEGQIIQEPEHMHVQPRFGFFLHEYVLRIWSAKSTPPCSGFTI